MDGLKAWLRADPARGRALMQENKSYVFFRELPRGRGRRGSGRRSRRDAHARPQPCRRYRLSCARHADLRHGAGSRHAGGHAVPAADDRAGRRLGDQGAGARRHLSGERATAAGAIAGSTRGSGAFYRLASEPLSRACAMLRAMGKRDTELETDAELWARVARSAKPLDKGRVARTVEAPKQRAKAPAKEPSAAAVSQRPKPAAKPAPAARGRSAKPADGAAARARQAPGRGAARSARHAPARGACGAQALPEIGAREGLSPCAGHHRQGRCRRTTQAQLLRGR